jgi:hypothetical protein
MKHIKDLRKWAAAQHERIEQEYDPGVPYWVHYLVSELWAIGFNLGETTRRILWGHDIPEDVKIDEHGRKIDEAVLMEAGWSQREAIGILALTDEPGNGRKERKKKTLPKIARGGRSVRKGKVCDRGGSVGWGSLSGPSRHHKMYRREEPEFEHYLVDSRDVELLLAVDYLRKLLACKPQCFKEHEYNQRPLRVLVNSWIARKDELLNADDAVLLQEWYKLKALLDAHIATAEKYAA